MEQTNLSGHGESNMVLPISCLQHQNSSFVHHCKWGIPLHKQPHLFLKKNHRRKQGACMYVHLHSDLYNLFFWTKPGALLIHLRRKARWDYKSVWLHGKCDLIISSPIFPVIYPIAPLSKLYANKKQECFRVFLQTLLTAWAFWIVHWLYNLQ